MKRPRNSLLPALLLLVSSHAAAQTAELPPLCIVTAGVADLFRAPDANSEVVSQAIFGSPVMALELKDDWARVRTVTDDYTGWVERATIAACGVTEAYPAGKAARVVSLQAKVYREPNIETHRPMFTLPFGSRIEVIDEKKAEGVHYLGVRFPDGRMGWLQAGDVTFDERPLTIPESLALARRFLGVPYVWGGASSFGFDCSGFTQMLMRSRGVRMPRDSGPQSRWDGLTTIARSELQPGDLIFFGKPGTGKVNHTGMYIGDGEFIHATREDQPMVQIDRLDSEPWTSRFISARRSK